MIYASELSQLNMTRPTVVMLGKFDGMHRGHRSLAAKTTALAGDEAIPAALIMDRAEKRLLTREERTDMLADLGIGAVCELNLTEDFMSQSPEAFVRTLVGAFHPKAVVVGENFRFGCRRTGDPATLSRLGETFGFGTVVMPIISEGNIRISSTRIREALALGDMPSVNRYLGYDYFVTGEIVHGRHLGHTLETPTTNLLPARDKLLPGNGVYAARVTIDGRTYGGMTNVGVKPTVDGSFVGIETYIFDFDANVYGRTEKVTFLRKTRPESNFGSLEALKARLEKDKKEVREYLTSIDVM